jgi:tetratricopeptide (TPR) repeat protein
MALPEQLITAARAAMADRRRDEARALVREAVGQLRTQDQPVELAGALRFLGEIERALAESDRGIGAYEEAVAIFRAEDQHARLAHTLRHLADIQRDFAAAEDACRSAEEALTVYADHAPEDLEYANALRSAALANEAAGRRDRARSLWVEARRRYELSGVEAGVLESDMRLAQFSESRNT